MPHCIRSPKTQAIDCWFRAKCNNPLFFGDSTADPHCVFALTTVGSFANRPTTAAGSQPSNMPTMQTRCRPTDTDFGHFGSNQRVRRYQPSEAPLSTGSRLSVRCAKPMRLDTEC